MYLVDGDHFALGASAGPATTLERLPIADPGPGGRSASSARTSVPIRLHEVVLGTIVVTADPPERLSAAYRDEISQVADALAALL
jgi:hypothetical protein